MTFWFTQILIFLWNVDSKTRFFGAPAAQMVSSIISKRLIQSACNTFSWSWEVIKWKYWNVYAISMYAIQKGADWNRSVGIDHTSYEALENKSISITFWIKLSWLGGNLNAFFPIARYRVFNIGARADFRQTLPVRIQLRFLFLPGGNLWNTMLEHQSVSGKILPDLVTSYLF